jgi:hypothetical protein
MISSNELPVVSMKIHGFWSAQTFQHILERITEIEHIEFHHDPIQSHSDQRRTFDNLYRKLKNKFAPNVKCVEFNKFLNCNEFVKEFLNDSVNMTHVKLNWIRSGSFWKWKKLAINLNVVSVTFNDKHMNKRNKVLKKFPNVRFIRHWDMKHFEHAYLDITWQRDNAIYHPIKVYMTAVGVFPKMVRNNITTVTHLAIMASPFSVVNDFLNNILPTLNNVKEIQITIRGYPSGNAAAARRLEIVKSNQYIQRIPKQILSIDNDPPMHISNSDYPELQN